VQAKYYLAKINSASDTSDDAKEIKKACIFNLALCKLELNDFHGTIADCDEILKDDPTSSRALYRRGEAYVQLGQLPRGCEDIQKANEISPQDNVIEAQLKRVREAMQKKEATEEEQVQKKRKKEEQGESLTSDKADKAEDNQINETVPGYTKFMTDLSMQAYMSRGNAWCNQMGADSVDEIRENWEDFANAIGLLPLQKKRLQKHCQGA